MKKIRITMNAPAVITFGTCCIVATMLNYATEGVSNKAFFSTYRSSYKELLTYVRLFTNVFGHSDWTHLISNLSYILLLGPLLEEKHGYKMIIKIILSVAFVTALVNTIFYPANVLLGASGVVFAFILLSSFTGVKKSGEIPLTFLLVAAIYLVQQFSSNVHILDNVANSAHVLGGIIGAVVGFASIKKNN